MHLDHSSKMLKMGNYRILCLVFFVVFVSAGKAIDDMKCECGVFDHPTPQVTNGTPIIVKSPNFAISCDDVGQENCAKMCIALAEAARDKAPQVLCAIIKSTELPLRPMVYFSSCGSSWRHTNLTTTMQLCCKNKNPLPCTEEI